MNFYGKLNMAELSPASLLFKFFDKHEWDAIAAKYSYDYNYVDEATNTICTVFTKVARELEN